MKKIFLVLMLSALGLSLVSAKMWNSSYTFDKSVEFKKGEETWVKIKKANKSLGDLEHPYNFTPEQVKALLGTLKYFRPDPLSVTGNKGQEWDLFSEEEKDLLAPHIAQAFSKLGPRHWVDFSVMTFRGQTLTGSFRKTDGVLFVKNGDLGVAMRNIAVKYEFGKKVNEYDPVRGYRGAAKLVTGEGQYVATNPKSGAEWEEGNWIIVDLDQPIALSSPGRTESGMLNSLTSPQPTPEPRMQPAPQPAPVYVQPPPAQPAPQQQMDVKDRLSTLKELYEEGLITEQEYNQKRKDILEDL